MLAELLPILFLGFGLGAMHALDADHVMALLVLNNQKTRLRRIASCSAYWAIGHGGVLLFCGVLLFVFGVLIPEPLQWLAEFSVGLMLLGLGLACLWQLRKATLKIHTHGDIQHIHWHTDGHDQETTPLTSSLTKPLMTQKTPAFTYHSLQEKHKPLMVGMLHGLAGSAPVLALIPALNQGHMLLAVIYLLLFSVGMMLSMMIVGIGFAYFQQYLHTQFQSTLQWSRYILALLSIGLGAFWMFQASV